MFEQAISYALNRYVGAFIENVDSNQLGASLYSGKIEMKDMRLRKDLFDDAPVPFQLAYGRVGKIYLKIPFWDMFKSPLVIQIENVFGLVKIKPMSMWKSDIQVQAFKESTQAMLEHFETFIKQKLELERAKLEQPKEEQASFASQLVANILDNLEISVKNIYFRFEHKMSDLDESFALGVRLKQFRVFTPPSTQKSLPASGGKGPKSPQKGSAPEDDETELLSYKSAKLEGFSVFCDWEDIDNPEKGGVSLDTLIKQDQEYFSGSKASKKKATGTFLYL
jgi:hypothetical protein